MKSLKKRNIFIGIILLFAVISSFGYSLINNKNDEPAATEADATQLVEESTLVINEAGSVTLDDKYEKVIINVPDVQIENGSADSILVAAGVGEGDVTLLNVISKELTLQGGGANSIMITGKSEIESLFLERLDGALAVRVQDDSIVENAFVSKGSQDANIEGNFTNVAVEASDIKVDIQDAIIDSLSVAGTGSIIYANKNTSINSMIILAQAVDTSFTSDGNIESLIVDATNSHVNLNGKVETVYVRDGAENVVVTVAEEASLESFITSVPVTLNGKGKVNKVVADSDSDVTGDLVREDALPLTEDKKDAVNSAIRLPSKPKKTTAKSKATTLAAVKKPVSTKPASTKPEISKPTVKPEKPKVDKEEPKEEEPKEESKDEESKEEESKDEELKEEEPKDEELKEEEPKVEGNALAKEVLNKNLEFLYNTVKNPRLGSTGGEWAILALARGGYDVPKEYYDLYYKNIVKEVKELMDNNNGKLHSRKGTEHSRLMLALGALGKDVTDVNGYDIKEALGDFDYMVWQGINGSIFSLIALDSQAYNVPDIENKENQSTRQKYIDEILSKAIRSDLNEVEGWALFGNVPDPDITAMAIQGLTPYYDQPAVKESIDSAINSLSKSQNEEGGYSTMWGGDTLESTAQVIVALTGLNIDPHTDNRFIKNEKSLIDYLLTYTITDGGFAHSKPADKFNGMATEQGTYALVAYDRFINGQKRLYDMTDIDIKVRPLDELKPDVISILKSYKNSDDYSQNVKILEKAVDEGIASIKSAKTHKEVRQALKNSMKNIDAIKTDVEIEVLLKEQKIAKEELKNYKTASDYSQNKHSLEKTINEGITAIAASTTPEEVKSALKDAKVALDSLKTDAEIEALSKAQENAKEKLQNYKIATDYSQNAKLLEKAIDEGMAAIAAATTPEEVEKSLKGAKVAIDAIKTDAELEALLRAQKSAIEELENYKTEADYIQNKDSLVKTIDEGIKAIEAATTQEEVEKALGNAKTALDAIKTDAEEEVLKKTKEVLETNLEYMYENLKNPGFGTGGGEWSILSLARGGYNAPKEYYDLYTTNVEEKVEELMEKHKGKLDKNKGTEHSRLMLAYGALGKDITNVAGYDIREALADFKFTTRQGINGPIFALIALDTHGYDIPTIEDEKNQSTRQRFVDYILEREITQESGEVGGWALFGNNPDPDITGMAIQGLTPYYDEQPAVKKAIDAAVDWLSTAQTEDGGYKSWGSENSESVAQVIVALTGLGIDPNTDARFIKNGNSAIDNLLTFAVSEGGFMHVKAGSNTGGGGAAGKVDGMATDQGTYALVAYNRLVNNQNGLYDMSDVVLENKSSKTTKEKDHSKVDTTEEIAQVKEVKEVTHEITEKNEEISNDGSGKSTKDQEVSQSLNKKQVKQIEDDAETDPVETLSEIKENAQKELLNYLEMDKSNEEIESIEEVISEGETKVEEATTSEDITEILKDIKKLIDELSVDGEIKKESEETFDVAI